MGRSIRVVVLAAIAISRGALEAWSQPAPDSAAAQTQLVAICEALKSRGGSCGARTKGDAADSSAMSRDTSAVQGEQDASHDALVRPLDPWGRAVRISVDSGTVKLESAGADGEFGDADDIVHRCPTQ